jgi:hypothetical protein
VKAAGTLALALTAALAARTASATGGAYNVHPGGHLSWGRADGAGVCPDASAIEAEVSERLGDNPFARTPTQFVEAVVTQKPTGFEVAIAMRASDGKLLGNRSLTSSPGDCRSIATAAALTIAILIDPDALARARAPKPPPPPPVDVAIEGLSRSCMSNPVVEQISWDADDPPKIRGNGREISLCGERAHSKECAK